eukprot:1094126-Rhodomonas_salina.3
MFFICPPREQFRKQGKIQLQPGTAITSNEQPTMMLITDSSVTDPASSRANPACMLRTPTVPSTTQLRAEQIQPVSWGHFQLPEDCERILNHPRRIVIGAVLPTQASPVPNF